MLLFLQQWRAEWLKLLARKRTYLGFAVFVGLELLVLAFLHRDGMERFLERLISQQGGLFDYYFSATTLGFWVLWMSVFLLGALYLCLVGGDIVAKETEDGHLRLLLARPISRLRLLLVKYLTVTGYSILLVGFITLTAWLLGLMLQGWGGGLFAWAPEQGVSALINEEDSYVRYAMGGLALSLAMTTAASLAFFLSCLPIKPAAATIGALSYLLVDMILRMNHVLDDCAWLSLTGHMVQWVYVFTDPLEWAPLARAGAVLAAVNATLFTAGWLIFEGRDLKS
ncbi:MAG: ABC transporter permease [Verrucomicrobiales bacterium]|nr:ABC transporter permease [Verrucomicrobiales bacterium]